MFCYDILKLYLNLLSFVMSLRCLQDVEMGSSHCIYMSSKICTDGLKFDRCPILMGFK